MAIGGLWHMCEYINGAIVQEDSTMEKYIYDKSNGL